MIRGIYDTCYKKLTEIIPYENNPRKNDKAVEVVAESIRQCGYAAPIIIDENSVILAGHTRLKALTQLGYKEINVIVIDGLTEEQKKKYRLLDNKTNEFSGWEYDLLEDELQGINFNDYDFGFEVSDFDAISDLLSDNFIEKRENDTFGITFIFSKADEQVIKSYIKENGKDDITRKIVEIARGEHG